MYEQYFDLQLKLAAAYAKTAGVPLPEAVDRCTNLRRRCHLVGPSGLARWQEFLAYLGQAGTEHASALSASIALFDSRPKIEQPSSFGCFSFGCFSYDPPDASGVLRIHFVPIANLQASPLSDASRSTRMEELRSMFLHIRQAEPRAISVRGVSWLYNLNAYTRLFPPPYQASIRRPWFPVHLTGTSTWGQVLNWRQGIKPAVRDVVTTNMATMSPEAPWEVFPLQALVATSEIGPFFSWFKCD